MKTKILAFLVMACWVMLTGCEKDNYQQPKSVLKGRIVHDGQAIGLRSNGVQLELWQHGYQLFTKIPVYIQQDGTFSASLFDGNYKLVRLRGNGPWIDNSDSIDIQLKGSMELDVPVTPYFVFKNDTYQKGEKAVSATFNLQQVNTSRQIERVNLYIGTTTIVDANNNTGNVQKVAADLTDLTKPVTLTAPLSEALASREYVFVRLGVKTAGVGEMLFGAPQKIQLK
jgi:hypothetical protein